MSYEIICVPRDSQAIDAYALPIRDFRLLTLQTNPEAFGSTYERAVDFADAFWRDRLANPQATHFIVVEAGQILCMLVINEMGVNPEDSSPTAEPWSLTSLSKKDPTQLHLRINGMFTRPAARRRGIAQALIRRALEYGGEQARSAGQRFVATLVVDSDNPPARALYEACGFTYMFQVPVPFGRTRDAMIMKCEYS